MEFNQEFEAALEDSHGDGGLFVVLPLALSAAFDPRSNLLVSGTLDGFPHRGSLKPLGDGYLALPIPREVRRALGKTVGDTLRVTLAPDEAPPQAELPADLAAALAATPAAAKFFRTLAYPDQRDYARWLLGAKKPEIRAKRLTETLYRLGQGLKRA